MSPYGRTYLRVAVAARIFVALALLAPALWAQDSNALVAMCFIAGVWLVVSLLETQSRIPAIATTLVESVAVGAVCGFSLRDSLAVLGALALPPFVASVRLNVPGVLASLVGELAGLVVLAAAVHGPLAPDQGYGVFSWMVTGLGLGLIGTFLNRALNQRPDPLTPYLDAQDLIRQLIDISGGLDSGIDPVTLGGSILSQVSDELPSASLTLHVSRHDDLTRLLTKTFEPQADLGTADALAIDAWALGQPVIAGNAFAFPLTSQAGTAAVVAGSVSDRIPPHVLVLDDTIKRLMVSLQASAVHLDTALLFATFRDSVTAEERKRLGREIHDGVAQEIASLGYLVDTMRAAAHPEQVEQMALLRERITSVVAEIRRSVVTLRTAVGASESLGAAIGSIARNLSEVSGVPIHVTLDERTDRLRANVEGELFRIAQEAMNNAVKHAGAHEIHVHCQVHAPEAVITVRDDGVGLKPGRPTSHGLGIMHERALLIGADLDIAAAPTGGVVVSVRVSGATSTAPLDGKFAPGGTSTNGRDAARV
jgi:signal transduction histidine kinase